jgi:hypothetical protein
VWHPLFTGASCTEFATSWGFNSNTYATYLVHKRYTVTIRTILPERILWRILFYRKRFRSTASKKEYHAVPVIVSYCTLRADVPIAASNRCPIPALQGNSLVLIYSMIDEMKDPVHATKQDT